MFSEINTSICELPRPFSLTMACSISSRFFIKQPYILLYPVYGINTNTVFLVLVGTNGSTGLTGSSLPPHDARTRMEKRRRKKCLSIENKVESPTRNLSLWGGERVGLLFIYITYFSTQQAIPSARQSSPQSRSASCAPWLQQPLGRGLRTSRWIASS